MSISKVARSDVRHRLVILNVARSDAVRDQFLNVARSDAIRYQFSKVARSDVRLRLVILNVARSDARFDCVSGASLRATVCSGPKLIRNSYKGVHLPLAVRTRESGKVVLVDITSFLSSHHCYPHIRIVCCTIYRGPCRPSKLIVCAHACNLL